MKAIVLTRDELTYDEIRALWDQDVNMDDWDYIVLAPVDSLEYIEPSNNDYDEYYKESNYEQSDFYIDKLLNGCFDNIWYKAKFRGKFYAIGVAYHS